MVEPDQGRWLPADRGSDCRHVGLKICAGLCPKFHHSGSSSQARYAVFTKRRAKNGRLHAGFQVGTGYGPDELGCAVPTHNGAEWKIPWGKLIAQNGPSQTQALAVWIAVDGGVCHSFAHIG